MIKSTIKIFSIPVSLLFTGCIDNNITINIPIKGNSNTYKCKKINIISNNNKIKTIFNNLKNNIQYNINSNNICKINIKSSIVKKFRSFNKRYVINYHNKKRCNYFVKRCIIENNTKLCSNPPDKNKLLYNKIKKNYTYINSNKKLYYYNNHLYSIYKTCNPKYINLKCNRIYFSEKDKYYINNKLIDKDNFHFVLYPCKNYHNPVEINDIKYNNNNIYNILNNKLTNIYNNKIQYILHNNFTTYKTININISDIDFKCLNDKKINVIIKNINNNNFKYNDYSYIKKKLKYIQKNNINYFKLNLLFNLYILKLELYNENNFRYLKKTINKDIYYLEDYPNENKVKDLYNKLLNIYNNISF